MDDGSADPGSVAEVATAHGAGLVANDRNGGPAFARNRGAEQAVGELLAFIDSDCVADPGWLRALTPYFAWERVGAVGGRTIGYHSASRLDRYEEVSSPLDMGAQLLFEGAGTNSLYAPTCNLLVRRSVYQDLGGLRERLRLGEDVDFCWRLRESGRVLVYSPDGVVRHKHLDRLGALLRRRRTTAAPRPPCTPCIRRCAGACACRRPPRRRWPWSQSASPHASRGCSPLALAPPAWDAARRARRLRRGGATVTAAQVCSSTLRGHLSALYFAYFRLVRYHLAPLAAGGLVAPGVWLLAALAIVYAGGVDYARRRPTSELPGVPLLLRRRARRRTRPGVIAGRVRARLGRAPAVPPRAWSIEGTEAGMRT